MCKKTNLVKSEAYYKLSKIADHCMLIQTARLLFALVMSS